MKNRDGKVWQACMWQVGTMITVSQMGDKDKIMEKCGKMEHTNAKQHCIMASAYQVKYDRFPNWPTTSKSLCNALPRKNTRHCFTYISQLPD